MLSAHSKALKACFLISFLAWVMWSEMNSTFSASFDSYTSQSFCISVFLSAFFTDFKVFENDLEVMSCTSTMQGLETFDSSSYDWLSHNCQSNVMKLHPHSPDAYFLRVKLLITDVLRSFSDFVALPVILQGMFEARQHWFKYILNLLPHW